MGDLKSALMRFHTMHHIYKFALRKKGLIFFLREILTQPDPDWILSLLQELNDLTHSSWNFEGLKAYPAESNISTFYTHHTLKVVPPDSVLVEVELDSTNGRYPIKSVLP